MFNTALLSKKTNKTKTFQTSDQHQCVKLKANLRVNLFSTGVFSSSELSSAGKQRWYKQQGGMDSETHSSTQSDGSRHLQNNRGMLDSC